MALKHSDKLFMRTLIIHFVMGVLHFIGGYFSKAAQKYLKYLQLTQGFQWHNSA